MKQEQFSKIINSTMESTAALLLVKGGEYAGSEDRLSNFKRGAALTGCTPLQVAFIYAAKHFDGISSFVKSSAEGKVRPSSEPISGRFDDLINYCILMKALVEEGGASGDLCAAQAPPRDKPIPAPIFKPVDLQYDPFNRHHYVYEGRIIPATSQGVIL